MKKNYKAVFKGSYQPSDVFFREIASRRRRDASLERRLEAVWKEKMEQAKNKGKKLWDSLIYRLEQVSLRDGSLYFAASAIPFSKRLSMNDFTEKIKKLGLAYAPRGMFTSCFVRTADDKYVFIEKSDKYFTDRKLSFIGGVLSRSEGVISSGSDLFWAAEREIGEEVGVGRDQIQMSILRAGYMTENFNFCLIFTVDLRIDFKNVLAMFSKKTDLEAKGVVGIEKDKLKEFAAGLPAKDKPKFQLVGL